MERWFQSAEKDWGLYAARRRLESETQKLQVDIQKAIQNTHSNAWAWIRGRNDAVVKSSPSKRDLTPAERLLVEKGPSQKKLTGREQLAKEMKEEKERKANAERNLSENKVYQMELIMASEEAKKKERKKDLAEIHLLLGEYSYLPMPPNLMNNNLDLKATIRDLKLIIKGVNERKQAAAANKKKRQALRRADSLGREAPILSRLNERADRRTMAHSVMIGHQADAAYEKECAAAAAGKSLKNTKSI
jgi:hypothetical protein